jgi:HEAT repeat protein
MIDDHRTLDLEIPRRVETIKALGIERDTGHLDSLTEGLDDPAHEVRVMASRAIGWLRSMDGVSPLLRILGDPHPDVRASVVASLALCGDAACGGHLITLIGGDPEENVRAEACRVLGWLRVSPACEQLLRAMTDDPSVVVKAQAARALGRLAYAPATSSLIDALGSDYGPLRTFAALALGEIGAETAHASIEARAHDSDPEVRAAVIRVTTSSNSAGAESIARNALDDPNPGVRATGAVALMHQANPASLPLLRSKSDDPHPEVRARIADAIVAMDPSRPSNS